MKTFNDLIFQNYEVDPIIDRLNPTHANYLRTLKHCYIEFENRYGLSICFGRISPINKLGYGVGVFKDQKRLHNTGYDRHFTTKQDIEKIMFDIQKINNT